MKINTSGTLSLKFKEGPSSHDAQNCIDFAMQILNLSFFYALNKNKKTGRKMQKTQRIRIGINKFVNKTDVTHECVNNLISQIRKGGIKKVNAEMGAKVIELHPNSDVPGIIAKLMVKKII